MKKSGRPVYALLGDSLDDEHEAAVLRGAIAAAREAGVTLVCISGGEVEHPDPSCSVKNFVFDLACSENVCGVLALTSAISNWVGPARLNEWFARFEPLPVCCAGVAVAGYPSVCVDNAGGVRNAVEHLIQVHSKRSIAFIRGPAASVEAENRLAAYRQALQNAGIGFEPRWVVDGDYNKASGVLAVRTLLDERKVNIDLLEALVAANDMMALGALEELHRRGIRVPDQLALVGFDDVDSARVARPTLTTVHQPSESIGREALRQLVAVVEPQPRDSSRLLPTELVVRESCGCVASALSQVLRSQSPLMGASVEAAFLRQRQVIAAEVARAARGRFGGAGAGWENRWIDALLGELRGDNRGGFARKLQQSLQAIEHAGGDTSPAQAVLAVLRRHSLPCVASDSEARALLEDVLHDAQVAAGALVAQGAAATVRNVGVRYRTFARSVQALMFGDVKALSETAAEHLPYFGVEACVVARLPTPGAVEAEVQVLFGFGPGARRVLPETRAARSLISHPVFANVSSTLFVLPVTLLDQALGVLLLSATSVDGVFLDDLRDLFSTVLKVVSLGDAAQH